MFYCILHQCTLHVQLPLLTCIATCLAIIPLRCPWSQPQTVFTHIFVSVAFNALPHATFGSFHTFQAFPCIIVQHPHSLCKEIGRQVLATSAGAYFGSFSFASARCAFAAGTICPRRLRPFPGRKSCRRFPQMTRATQPRLDTILTHPSC